MNDNLALALVVVVVMCLVVPAQNSGWKKRKHRLYHIDINSSFNVDKVVFNIAYMNHNLPGGV